MLYYFKNRDILREKQKIYWNDYKIKHKEKINKYAELYRENNRKICRERVKQWTQSEKKSTSDWSITLKWLENILISQQYLCSMCWKNITNRKDRHLDHIYPLSKWWVDTIKNVQWLCVKCNLSKWDKIL